MGQLKFNDKLNKAIQSELGEKNKIQIDRFQRALAKINFLIIKEINGTEEEQRTHIDTLNLNELEYGLDFSISQSLDSLLNTDKRNQLELNLFPIANDKDSIVRRDIKKIAPGKYLIPDFDFKYYVVLALIKASNVNQSHFPGVVKSGGLYITSNQGPQFIGWAFTPHNIKVEFINGYWAAVND